MLIRAFLLLVLLSCNVSYAALFGDDEAREQINALRKQVKEMEARIAKMEEALNSQALLELYSKVETLEQELGKLNGQIEMLGNDNALLQKRQRDFYIDLDNRLRQIEQQSPQKRSPSSHFEPNKGAPGSAAAPSPSPSPSEQAAAAPPLDADTVIPESPSSEAADASATQDSAAVAANELTPPGTTESGAYKAAFDLFKNGEYANAIAQFESFLENYPQSNLAPGAAYWIGNARYALRDYQLAIDAQRKLISNYPASNKVPDAFLNIASSQLEMGDSKASKQTLENLLAKYPQSDAAKKAKQRLANIK
ncbi:tol-pal system protein YbgF [Nitrosomonas sp. Is35]|uniref:tol-pal system protein YbgF n=1 Tax=Nitrosomonas sp. Is35 TaxID=3080534 RepID=UPI00294B91B8|nr:tol-pal system protein YbgF [Nitrosomonas sp. Is35]MDV6346119.1 tol-pal system protein YbgF [Nitrosomonas sp. Is35]